MKAIKITFITILIFTILIFLTHFSLRAFLKHLDDPGINFTTNFEEISPLPENWKETSELWESLFIDNRSEITKDFKKYQT